MRHLLLIFSLLVLSPNLLAQDKNIEEMLDSLFLQYIQDNQLKIDNPAALIGEYISSLGFVSGAFKLYGNGTYEYSSHGCFGLISEQSGTWEADRAVINFTARDNKKRQAILIKLDENFALMFLDAEERFRAFATDIYNAKGEEALKDFIADRDKIINMDLFERDSPTGTQ